MQEPSKTDSVQSVAVQVPSFLADLGSISAIGPTIHLVLGSTMPDGSAVHRAHVALSREFAQELASTLARALRPQADAQDAANAVSEAG